MGFFFNTKKFPITPTTTVYTTRYVIKDHSPITLVARELDGDWQFMGSEPIGDYSTTGMVANLEDIIKLDKSVLQVADLPVGHQATRSNKKDKWKIEKIIYEDWEIKDMGYYCSDCGKYHREIPMAYVADVPFAYTDVPEDEVEQRCELTGDQCVIDEKEFYIKGQVSITVDDQDEFAWNLWVSVSEDDFCKITDSWNDDNRIYEEPYNGILATRLECYPDTIGLHVKIYQREVGIMPSIVIQECNHPLYLEQDNGINRERVVSFARQLLYNH